MSSLQKDDFSSLSRMIRYLKSGGDGVGEELLRGRGAWDLMVSYV